MKNTFPKYLVEMDREESTHVTGGNDDLPPTELWIARLRNPYALALIDATGDRYESGGALITFWPPVLDADLNTLADRMTRALFREWDIYPGDWSAPEIKTAIIEPPEFLLMTAGPREFVLDTKSPRLWRLKFGADDQPQSITWWKGFGRDPEFPRDTRRVTEFLKTL